MLAALRPARVFARLNFGCGVCELLVRRAPFAARHKPEFLWANIPADMRQAAGGCDPRLDPYITDTRGWVGAVNMLLCYKGADTITPVLCRVQRGYVPAMWGTRHSQSIHVAERLHNGGVQEGGS